MRVDVGVDGGQSQIRLAVAGRDEIVTSDGVAHSDGDTVALLVERVAEAWGRAGHDLELGRVELGRIVLGLTTMPEDASTVTRLGDAVAAATGAAEVVLCGDAVTAHAGAFPDRHGVVMVVGTGIACLAIDSSTGRSRRVDGDGYLLGDNGAAFWIGRRGVAAALAAADGRGGPTTLSQAVEERYGSLPGLATRLHALERPVNAIAQFAAVVQQHARAGDSEAQRIAAAAAAEIVESIRAGAQIFAGGPVPVALTGRTVSEGSVVRETVERLIGDDPGLVLVEAAGSPLDGALGLAAGDLPPAYESLISIRRTT